MSGKILIAVLLVGLTIQQCTIGCLKCNSLNQCVICDSTNNYYLNGNTCSLSTQTNCNVLGLTGSCVTCNTNYYLDVNSQRCLAVTNSSLIANCASYNSGQVCVQCNGNFYLLNGQCAAVNTTIANCQVYGSTQQCVQCASGYIVNTANSACVAVSSSSCLYYTFLGCRTCASGFVLNSNLYFTNFGSASYVSANYLAVSTSQRTFDWIGLSQCQAVTVRNCLVYAAFNTCTTCAAGYYLQNGNCIAYPLAIIFACQTYSSLTTCTGCQAGYYLSSNTCLANSVIANCLTYSGTATTTTCVACNTGYYLQGNTCANRTVSANIANCQTVSVTADLCASCVSGFILTSDSRACLAAIANCATYASGSTFQSSNLQCSLCNNGYYLTNSGSVTVCTAGSVQFCLTYQVNANSCTVCQNGYYLQNSNSCLAHVSIANCATYDATRANYCATCNSGYYNFVYTTVCVATTIISNCAAYQADGNSCLRCASGYYANGNTCAVIPSTFANCATYASNQCSLCNSGYMVNTLPTVGTCVLPLDYIIATNNSPCAIRLVAGSTQTPTWIGTVSATQFVLSCGTCSDYMYGYNPTQPEAICVNTNQLALYSGYTAVSNCIRYGLNYATSPTIVCMQCASGWYISSYVTALEKSTATTCVSTCAADASAAASPAVIPDDMLGFVNICVPNTGTGFNSGGRCSRWARVVLDNVGATTGAEADYVCWSVWTLATTGPVTPTNIMVYNGATAVTTQKQYLFESPSATTQSTLTALVGSGYSNTVDLNSVYPNVFNYLGLPAGPHYAGGAGQLYSIALPAAFSNTNVLNTILNNCDIAVWLPTASVGDVSIRAAAGANGLTANGADQYGCLRCSFGYQVSYVAAATGPIASFPSCVQMTTCASTNTVYGGLPQFLNSILSCHVCSTSNGAALYPTVAFEYHGVTTPTANFVTWATKGIVTGNGGAGAVTVASVNGFKCAPALTALQTTNTYAAAGAAVSNCAVYALLQTIATLPPTATGHVTGGAAAPNDNGFNACLACAANFWPSYLGAYDSTAGNGIVTGGQSAPRYIVTGCTASLNCDTSVITQFNGCGKCRSDQENNVTPVYYAFHDMTFSNCFQAASRNCLILSTTAFSASATNNACDVCKAGYFLNVDNQCEQLRVPNENVSTGIFVNAYVAARAYVNGAAQTFTGVTTDNKYTRLHYLLSYKQLQYGVNSCTSGYTLAPANTWAPRLCVWSSYVYNNTGNFPASSNFINNCVRYNLTQVNSKNVCGGCTTGYIPTQDGTACVSSSSVPNCFYAQNSPNTALCYQCLTNFNNVNGVCSSTTIPNCATYVNTQWSFTTPSALTCATCINGFVLSSDALSCTVGSVSNCIQYTQGRSLVCTACATGYVLMTLNTVYYCYPIPSSLNCALLQDTSPNSGANYGTISCATCNTNSVQVFGVRQWTALGLTTQAQTLCMPFTPISNCNAYDQNNAVIKANTFGCATCASGYWYSASNYTCVPRSNQPAQCATYNPTADLCTACNTGSFLSADGTNCVSFPNGIFQCRLYSGATTCTQCNSPYYLSNNACVISTVVANCLTYSANYTCSACAAGFFLQNSTACVTATAVNCLTYTSITACASCNTGFGLQTTNGVTNCVAVNLNNCLNATTVSPFTCLTCSTGFYPNSNGVCTAVSQTIANCITYDTATTCSICSSNSVLNVARTACNTTAFSAYADPNCAQNFLLSQPACTQCAPGNYFVNGTCSSCTNNTYAAGCYSCDPTNVNTCLLCRPTYYMNAAGACVANNPTNNNNTNNNNTNNNNTSSATTVAVGVAAALVTLFYDWA